jgi:hypothetical protein
MKQLGGCAENGVASGIGLVGRTRPLPLVLQIPPGPARRSWRTKWSPFGRKVGAYLTNGVPFHLKRLRTLRVADRVRYVKKVDGFSVAKPGRRTDELACDRETTAPDSAPSRRAGSRERASLSYHLAMRSRYRPYSSRITVIAANEWCKSEPFRVGFRLKWSSTGFPAITIRICATMQTVADLLRAALKRAR